MRVTHSENPIFPSESSVHPYDPDLMNEEMKPCLWFAFPYAGGDREKLWVSHKKYDSEQVMFVDLPLPLEGITQSFPHFIIYSRVFT